MFIKMNGPRAIVVDAASAELPDAKRRMYGDLEMQLLATLNINPAQSNTTPYSELTVKRTNTWGFWSGFETYQLVSPDGTTYVMQAMSQIVDPSLTLADLSGLGSRLALPEGWSYQVNRQIIDLVLAADGEAVVVQDELENTYQRVEESSMNSNTTSPILSILADGTGTECDSNTECQGLDASHCLNSAQLSFCTIQGYWEYLSDPRTKDRPLNDLLKCLFNDTKLLTYDIKNLTMRTAVSKSDHSFDF